MGGGRQDRSQLGVHGKRSWSSVDVGDAIFRLSIARERAHVPADRSFWRTQLNDDLGGKDAREEGITREQADKWSVRSHQRACAATESGKFKEEIVPIVIAQKKGKSLVIETDEPPRSDTAFDQLSKLLHCL